MSMMVVLLGLLVSSVIGEIYFPDSDSYALQLGLRSLASIDCLRSLVNFIITCTSSYLLLPTRASTPFVW